MVGHQYEATTQGSPQRGVIRPADHQRLSGRLRPACEAPRAPDRPLCGQHLEPVWGSKPAATSALSELKQWKEPAPAIKAVGLPAVLQIDLTR